MAKEKQILEATSELLSLIAARTRSGQMNIRDEITIAGARLQALLDPDDRMTFEGD